MPKLTKSQTTILSKAAAREDGAAVIATTNKAAAAKVAAGLLASKLMREVQSKSGMPIWLKDGKGRAKSLVITPAGRGAVAAAIQRSGRDSVKSNAVGAEIKPSLHEGVAHEKGYSPEDAAAAVRQAKKVAAVSSPRSGSKQALVVGMLTKPQGARLDALVAATGWLPHTARAALTGLRKRGFAIERQRREGDGASTYHIVASAKSAA